MKYIWNRYGAEHADAVESWLDAEARRGTGCDDFGEFYRYWSGEATENNRFACRVVSDGIAPFAVVAAASSGAELTVMELVVAPEKRGRGLGTAVLRELLSSCTEIFGFDCERATAVIFPSNAASVRAFSKASFVLDRAHPDGDALYYRYDNPLICYCGQDCSRCRVYLATVNDDGVMREEARRFYADVLGRDVPLSLLHCRGGRSEDVFYLCAECPWAACCRDNSRSSCTDCRCEGFVEYEKKYVNKYNV